MSKPNSRPLLYLHIPEINISKTECPYELSTKTRICKTSPLSANCFKPIRMCQPLSWTVKNFAAIPPQTTIGLRLFIPCVLQIFAFADYVSLLGQRYTGRFCAIFACPNSNSSANHKQILSLPSSGKQTELDCRGIAGEFNRDIWHGSRVSDATFLCFKDCFLSLYSSKKNRKKRESRV